MSTNQFITFQKFSDKQDALIFKEKLEKNGIEPMLEDVSASVDVTFSGNTHDNQYLLKIRKNEFERANEILENQAKLLVNQISKDHYLFDFTDEELFELIEKSDEWSKEDYFLAIKILKERGHNLDTTEIEEIKKKRLSDLRSPETGKAAWLFAGFVFSFLGGIIGLMIGWSHWKSIKVDPTGKRFYVYDEKTRKSGRTIFLFGVFFFIFWIIVGLFTE